MLTFFYPVVSRKGLYGSQERERRENNERRCYSAAEHNGRFARATILSDPLFSGPSGVSIFSPLFPLELKDDSQLRCVFHFSSVVTSRHLSIRWRSRCLNDHNSIIEVFSDVLRFAAKFEDSRRQLGAYQKRREDNAANRYLFSPS